MGQHEPYWRTNTSFSPPPSRWDFRFQSEGLPYGSHDGIPSYGSSTSSNSKESKDWLRGNLLYNNQFSASDSVGLFLSSPSDLSQGPQWTPPAIQEISIDGHEASPRRDPVLRQFSFTPTIEGTSINPDSRVSTSSHSDSSESELRAKSCTPSSRNFSSRLSFMSKPVYPLSFSTQIPVREATDTAATSSLDYDGSTPLREANHWSSASSSIDFANISEPFESESSVRSCMAPEGFKCGLCERFLTQRSPWSSRRIVRSGDMPVVGVLSCDHVFHADCLEQTTPKSHKSDPPCPFCVRLQGGNSLDQQILTQLGNGFTRPRPSCEDGQSRPWGCAQVGDFVEGAVHLPPRNTMLLLNRNRIKKNLSLKGNSSKGFPGKLRKNGASSSQLFIGKSVDQGAVGCSKMTAGPSMKN